MDNQLIMNKEIILKDYGSELIDRFIANLDRKDTTKETYRKALKQWLTFLNIQNKNPDINLILQYKNFLIEKKLSPYSISVYLSALKVFLDYLVEHRIIPYNPAKSIRGIKKPKSKRDALTKDEALRLIELNLLNTNEDYRNKAILLLKLFTGLRDISIVKADIEDLQVKDGRYILYYQSKGRDIKDDFVVLSGSVYTALSEYFRRRDDIDPKSPLFISYSDRNKGNRLTTQSIRVIIKNLFKKVGIIRPEIKSHSLRHSAITFAILGGADITQTKEMASHSSIQSTSGYFHDLNRLKDPAEFYIQKYLYNG